MPPAKKLERNRKESPPAKNGEQEDKLLPPQNGPSASLRGRMDQKVEVAVAIVEKQLSRKLQLEQDGGLAKPHLRSVENGREAEKAGSGSETHISKAKEDLEVAKRASGLEADELDRGDDGHCVVVWNIVMRASPHVFAPSSWGPWTFEKSDDKMTPMNQTASQRQFRVTGVTSHLTGVEGVTATPWKAIEFGDADYKESDRELLPEYGIDIGGVNPIDFGRYVHGAVAGVIERDYGAVNVYNVQTDYDEADVNAAVGASVRAATRAIVSVIEYLTAAERKIGAVEYGVTSAIHRELGYSPPRGPGGVFLSGAIDLVLSKGNTAVLVDYKVRAKTGPLNRSTETTPNSPAKQSSSGTGGSASDSGSYVNKRDALQLMWLAVLFTMQTEIPVSELWVINVYRKGPHLDPSEFRGQYRNKGGSTDYYGILDRVRWESSLIEETMPKRWKILESELPKNAQAAFRKSIQSIETEMTHCDNDWF